MKNVIIIKDMIRMMMIIIIIIIVIIIKAVLHASFTKR